METKDKRGGKRPGAGKRKDGQPKKKRTKKSRPGTLQAEIDKITPHPRVGDDVDQYGPADKKVEALIGAPGAKPKPKPPPPKTEPPSKEEQSQFELKLIADFLKMPFAIWAKRINYPPIRLTEGEAHELAVPTRTLLDHYMPLIPPITYAWIAWGIIATNVVDKRMDMIAAEKERRQPAPSADKGQTPVAPQPASEKQGAPAYKPKKV